MLLTVRLYWLSIPVAVFGIAMMLAWMWHSDPGPTHAPIDVGGGRELPVYLAGRQSHSWWAMVTLLLVVGAIFSAMVFSYLYLWATSPQVWPAASGQALPALTLPLVSAALLVLASLLVHVIKKRLARTAWVSTALLMAAVLLSAALYIDTRGLIDTGLTDAASAYGAAVYTLCGLQGVAVFASAIMLLFCAARAMAGRLAPARAAYEVTALFMH